MQGAKVETIWNFKDKEKKSVKEMNHDNFTGSSVDKSYARDS